FEDALERSIDPPRLPQPRCFHLNRFRLSLVAQLVWTSQLVVSRFLPLCSSVSQMWWFRTQSPQNPLLRQLIFRRCLSERFRSLPCLGLSVLTEGKLAFEGDRSVVFDGVLSRYYAADLRISWVLSHFDGPPNSNHTF
ncbi:hypothetical protein TCAL_15720, partial [Tigriopus californicus]